MSVLPKLRNKISDIFFRVPIAIRYGLVLACGLIVLKTLEYQLFSFRFSQELYTGFIATIFTLVGLLSAFAWFRISTEKHNDQSKIIQTLSIKEQKILLDLSLGLTNQQIADKHHVSINTTKTHLKTVYKKLQVSSRNEAVYKAKSLGLLE